VYEILIERRAEKDLKKLPADLFQQFIPCITNLKKNPRPLNSRKMVGSKSDYRLKTGDYRILYEINDKTREIRIFRIRHRREAYR